MINKLFLVAFVLFSSSCYGDRCALNVDILLNISSNPVIHDYGFGDIKLLNNETKLVRTGEFPISLIVLESKKHAKVNLAVSFINRVPGQMVGISMNFIDVHTYRFDSAQKSGECVDDSYVVSLRPGINILKIAYLNSEKTGPEHEYVLGRKRVEFSKLALSCLEK